MRPFSNAARFLMFGTWRTSMPNSERLFLLDFDMPGMSVHALKAVVDLYPGTVVAVISGAASNSRCAGRNRFGGARLHSKNRYRNLSIPRPSASVVWRNKRTGRNCGRANSSPANSIRAAAAAPWISALTRRETDVLRLLTRGLSNKQIGRELDLAEVTIKLHLRNIFRKIGAATRSEAAVLATKANFPKEADRGV